MKQVTAEHIEGFFHGFDVLEQSLLKQKGCQGAVQTIRNKRVLYRAKLEKADAPLTPEEILRLFQNSDSGALSKARAYNPGPNRKSGPFRTAFARAVERLKPRGGWPCLTEWGAGAGFIGTIILAFVFTAAFAT